MNVEHFVNKSRDISRGFVLNHGNETWIEQLKEMKCYDYPFVFKTVETIYNSDIRNDDGLYEVLKYFVVTHLYFIIADITLKRHNQDVYTKILYAVFNNRSYLLYDYVSEAEQEFADRFLSDVDFFIFKFDRIANQVAGYCDIEKIRNTASRYGITL